jgi:outer membrane protein
MIKIKTILFSLFFILLQINLLSSNENIVFVDVDYVIKNSNVGKKALEKINNLDKKNIDTLKKKNSELQKLEIELKNKQNIITEDAFQLEVKNLKEKVNSYKKEKKTMVTNLNKFKNEEISKVFEQISPIISKYMENNSIKIVFDSKNIFMGASSSDITKTILDEINNQIN